MATRALTSKASAVLGVGLGLGCRAMASRAWVPALGVSGGFSGVPRGYATKATHPVRAQAATAQAAQPPPPAPAAAGLPTLSHAARNITLTWQQPTAAGVESSFNFVWLRDHCQCADCIHPDNRQKLHSSADIPLDIKPTSVKLVPSPKPALEITWEKRALVGRTDEPKVHTSLYDLAWLRSQDYKPASVVARDTAAMAMVNWDRKDLEKDPKGALWTDFSTFMTDEGRRKVVDQMYVYGLAFLRGVPIKEDAIVGLCERLGGHVHETFYGKTFDVKSVGKSTNIAYTSLFLGLHMDLMYMESPPGLQLLHSLQNTVKGGASFFSDSFAAAEKLRATHPADFDILTKVPVTFHYDNNGHHLRFRHPTIADYDGNEPMRVYYAPPFQGTLECPPEKVDAWYQAFARFRDYLEHPDMVYTHRLEPGECVLFNNRRVFHARDQFDATSGDRFFKGAYVDWDHFKDKYRVLVQKHEAAQK